MNELTAHTHHLCAAASLPSCHGVSRLDGLWSPSAVAQQLEVQLGPDHFLSYRLWDQITQLHQQQVHRCFSA